MSSTNTSEQGTKESRASVAELRWYLEFMGVASTVVIFGLVGPLLIWLLMKETPTGSASDVTAILVAISVSIGSVLLAASVLIEWLSWNRTTNQSTTQKKT